MSRHRWSTALHLAAALFAASYAVGAWMGEFHATRFEYGVLWLFVAMHFAEEGLKRREQALREELRDREHMP